MAWVTLTFAFGSVLTSNKMGQLRDNIAFAFQKDADAVSDGAVLADDYIVLAMMGDNSVELSNMTDNSVDTDEIVAGAVGSDEIAVDAVNFSSEINDVNVNVDFTFTLAGSSLVLAGGIYLFGDPVPNSATMDGTLYIDFLINGIWKVFKQFTVTDGSFTQDHCVLVGNNAATRLRFSYASGSASPQPYVRLKKIYA